MLFLFFIITLKTHFTSSPSKRGRRRQQSRDLFRFFLGLLITAVAAADSGVQKVFQFELQYRTISPMLEIINQYQ